MKLRGALCVVAIGCGGAASPPARSYRALDLNESCGRDREPDTCQAVLDEVIDDARDCAARKIAGEVADCSSMDRRVETVRSAFETSKRRRMVAKAQEETAARMIAEAPHNARQAFIEAERTELARCPNSSLPPGTYRTPAHPSGAFIALEVTDRGCAAFTFHIRLGAAEEPCTASGVVEAPTSARTMTSRITRSEGACGANRNRGLTQDLAFKVTTGETPSIEIIGTKGAFPKLARTSNSVELDELGRPRIWGYAHPKANDRASVVFGQ